MREIGVDEAEILVDVRRKVNEGELDLFLVPEDDAFLAEEADRFNFGLDRQCAVLEAGHQPIWLS